MDEEQKKQGGGDAKDRFGKDLLNRLYGGVILAVEPYVTDFKTITASSASYLWRGKQTEAIQAVVRAHPDNTGRVWVNIRAEPSSSDGWPLAPNEWVKVTILNMFDLRVLIVTDGDKVIVGRSS